MSEDTNLRNPQEADESEVADKDRAAPRLPDAPQKWHQDTQPVSGETATDMPAETESEDRQPVQG
jgi:hypothetical protein